MALFYDHMLVAIVCVIAIFPTIISVAETIQDPNDLFPLMMGSVYTIPAVIFVVVFGVLYEPLMTSMYGWTLGKRICGLKVVNDEGKQLTFGVSFLRFLIKTLCLSIPYANIVICVMSYLRQRKGEKAIWDAMIETNVIHEK